MKVPAGEKVEVKVHLPRKAFGLFDENGNLTYSGQAEIYVGTHAPDPRSEELTGTKPVKVTVSVAK